MRVPPIFYTNSLRNYQRKSVVKIYRKTENGWKVLNNGKKEEIPKSTPVHNQTKHEKITAKNDEMPNKRPDCRENEMKIQMLSQSLYDQIFRNSKKTTPDEETIKR